VPDPRSRVVVNGHVVPLNGPLAGGYIFREKCGVQSIESRDYGTSVFFVKETDRVAQVFVLARAISLLTMAAAGAAVQDIARCAYEIFCALRRADLYFVHEDHDRAPIGRTSGIDVGSEEREPGIDRLCPPLVRTL